MNDIEFRDAAAIQLIANARPVRGDDDFDVADVALRRAMALTVVRADLRGAEIDMVQKLGVELVEDRMFWGWRWRAHSSAALHPSRWHAAFDFILSPHHVAATEEKRALEQETHGNA